MNALREYTSTKVPYWKVLRSVGSSSWILEQLTTVSEAESQILCSKCSSDSRGSFSVAAVELKNELRHMCGCLAQACPSVIEVGVLSAIFKSP